MVAWLLLDDTAETCLSIFHLYMRSYGEMSSGVMSIVTFFTDRVNGGPTVGLACFLGAAEGDLTLAVGEELLRSMTRAICWIM